MRAEARYEGASTSPPQTPEPPSESGELNTQPHPPGEALVEADFDTLFRDWRRTGDPRLRDRMVLMHRQLVAFLARRFLDRGEMFEDIVQQGLVGLIRALDSYDPDRGVRFATFATPSIVGELRRYFRDKVNTVRVPRRLQELHAVVTHKIETLTQELDRSPTYSEVARSLGLTIEVVVEAMEVLHAFDPLSLDEQSSHDEFGGGASLLETLGASDPALEDLDSFGNLQRALERLSAKERDILTYTYFEGRSQSDIAERMKVSQMHVSRVLRRALTRLRQFMREEDLQ